MGREYFNRYKSYCKSVGNLEECRSADLNDAFVLPGIVQCFNLSFDLAWKVMKDILQKRMGVVNFASGSPREVLKMAFANGLIASDIWMKMLKTRNLLVHDYDGVIALESIEEISGEFLDEMIRFRESVAKLCEEFDEMDIFE